jgi:hypothetical protein
MPLTMARIPCEQCGRVLVPAPEAVAERQERFRRWVCAQLLDRGYPPGDATQRSYALATDHLFDRYRPWCRACRAKDAADWTALCEPAAVPCCYRNCDGPCEEAARLRALGLLAPTDG